jgi:hypothetical protein
MMFLRVRLMLGAAVIIGSGLSIAVKQARR